MSIADTKFLNQLINFKYGLTYTFLPRDLLKIKKPLFFPKAVDYLKKKHRNVGKNTRQIKKILNLKSFHNNSNTN